jgi:hypothetical protein
MRVGEDLWHAGHRPPPAPERRWRWGLLAALLACLAFWAWVGGLLT